MRRDSIFYRLFQRSPTLLFDLLAIAPDNAADYRFDCVSVKEPTFEIDGVFLPPETDPPGVVYFCEVQFQKDELLYERLFGESLLYFYRNRDRFSDWQAVILYPTRSLEQSKTHPYRWLLNPEQTDRIYLDELGDIEQLPLEVALTCLTTVPTEQTPESARALLARAEQADIAAERKRNIIEMIVTIITYKFTQMSRAEVNAMLGIRLQDIRAFQEAKEEGREEGREVGREEEALNLVVRLLNRRLSQELPNRLQTQIDRLPLPALEQLSEDLLDFTTLTDLETWLSQRVEPD